MRSSYCIPQLFTLAAIMLTGCASAPSANEDRDGSADPRLTDSTEGPRRAPGGQAPARLTEQSSQDLAALARRDVQAMATGPRLGEPADHRPRPERPRPGPSGDPPGAIHWDTPMAPATRAILTDRRTAIDIDPVAVDPVSPELSAAAEPAFVPGPLFRSQDDLDAPVTVNEPVSTAAVLQIDRISELLVELSRELYRESSYADMPLRELFVIAAHSIIRPERSLSPEAIPELTGTQRETLGHFQDFCRRLGEGMDGSREAQDVLTAALSELHDALVDEPQLMITAKELCYRIDGFGDFDAFDRTAFLAHEEQRVILYLEIQGFTSELNGKGEWVTELSQQLIIYSDHDGIPVWTADWQPAVDVSRNRRQDFFTVQVITLPKALSVGQYDLKIRLRDEKSRAETESGMQFEMVADPKLAASMP